MNDLVGALLIVYYKELYVCPEDVGKKYE